MLVSLRAETSRDGQANASLKTLSLVLLMTESERLLVVLCVRSCRVFGEETERMVSVPVRLSVSLKLDSKSCRWSRLRGSIECP